MRFSILLLLMMTSLFACNKVDEDREQMELEAGSNLTKFKNVKFAVNTDLVCKMSLSQGISDTLHHDNKIYGFCSYGCVAKFRATPEAYVK